MYGEGALLLMNAPPTNGAEGDSSSAVLAHVKDTDHDLQGRSTCRVPEPFLMATEPEDMHFTSSTPPADDPCSASPVHIDVSPRHATRDAILDSQLSGPRTIWSVHNTRMARLSESEERSHASHRSSVLHSFESSAGTWHAHGSQEHSVAAGLESVSSLLETAQLPASTIEPPQSRPVLPCAASIPVSPTATDTCSFASPVMPPSVATQLFVTCSAAAPESLEASLNMDLGSVGSVVWHLDRESYATSSRASSMVNVSQDSRRGPAMPTPPVHGQGLLIPAAVDAEPPVAKVLITDYSAADAKHLKVPTVKHTTERKGKITGNAKASGHAMKLPGSVLATMRRIRNAVRPQHSTKPYTVSACDIHAT
jgi:hypothetical protein